MPIGYKGENEDIVVEKFFSPNAGGSVLRMYFPGVYPVYSGNT